MDTSAFKFDDAEQMYDVIPALRALAIRDKQPETWKLFWNLMSHLDNWMKDPEWKVSHQYIIDFILDKLKVINTIAFVSTQEKGSKSSQDSLVGSALDWYSEGPGFQSCHHQLNF